ncbi:hypothetical protein SAMN04488490_0096 [Marinobacter sp. LV10R510-11A]|uniref:hypothetical protein n=1 Tax=Marinobacter sp. LV10R510-11A TaxID=1415568 RepID=UPI000BB74012|nr:hypothetical protein [Marinobacter sp. LV10R510-11A]SOB74607.1 hypothetical protein SAMN04488490_0096 [Marinobacter sp. LV10R510-11A]
MRKHQLQLAQYYWAAVSIEPTLLKRLLQLSQLMGPTGTIQQLDTPVRLLTLPVIYRTDDRQHEVLNAPQVSMSNNLSRLHPQSRVLVCRLIEPAALPMARLYYQILEPARLFGEIDPLIHAAFAETHDTALLRDHVLRVRPNQPITTKQLVELCGRRVEKSTINNRKKILGYTNPARGCKAKKFKELSNDSHAN